VSCAPSGDEGPTVYIQTKKKEKKKQKHKNNLVHVQIIIPVGCQIFCRIRRIEKHVPIGVVERMSQRKTDGLYICRRSIDRPSCKSYRGKRTQPKRLDGASVQDPFLNMPQGREVDNRLRTNHPHCQAPPE
jgi:hypothetical protein